MEHREPRQALQLGQRIGEVVAMGSTIEAPTESSLRFEKKMKSGCIGFQASPLRYGICSASAVAREGLRYQATVSSRPTSASRTSSSTR